MKVFAGVPKPVIIAAINPKIIMIVSDFDLNWN